MAVQFTLRVFFLEVPNELLRSYFESRDELRGFPWDRFTLAASDPLFDAWCALPERSRDETEGELRAVAELATREGMCHILEQGRARDLDLVPDLDERTGLCHKAFWVFLQYRRVFDAARQLDHVDHLNGRYWRTRTDLPRRAPDSTPTARRALGEALSAYYRQEQGCGAYCDVHCYLRGTKHYFVAYPEDLAETVLGYDGGTLQPRSHKVAFEVVFAYDPAAGTLDLHAQGDKRVHADLQRIFGRVILNVELPREGGSALPFRLDALKRRGFTFPTDPADGIREVRVKALRLEIVGGGRLTFDAGPLRKSRNVYDMMEKALDGESLPLSNVGVDAVTLQMVFDFDRARRRTLTFDMRPDSCNLRDAPEHLLAKHYLRRWDIACA